MRPITRTVRGRLPAIATVAALAITALTAGGSSASASSNLLSDPVPDFDNQPECLADIIGITCFVTGTATGGGEIVSWDWEYPGLFSDHASGQSTLLRFANEGVFDVTLTVTDDGSRTGSVTKPTVVNVSG